MRGMGIYCGLMAGGVLLAGVTVRGATVNDNFDDNAIGSQWTLLTDNASQLNLLEQNQRLELLANAPTSSHTDALYLSNGSAGFRLSTAQNFETTLDYHFSGYQSTGGSGDALALDFGVGRDLAGSDSAAIGFGYTNLGFGVASGATVAHRTDNTESIDSADFTTPTSGRFDISYNASADDLTFAIQGTSFSYSLQDTVKSIWGADDLLVSFGGRGDGFTTASGDAYLDNFTLVSGQTVPEPASSALVVIFAAAFLKPRRRSQGA